MSKLKHYEYRDNRDRRDSEGLKQRRLKDEARWKFRPTRDYVEGVDEEDDLDSDDYIEDEHYYR
jgi:hypothetical protein